MSLWRPTAASAASGSFLGVAPTAEGRRSAPPPSGLDAIPGDGRQGGLDAPVTPMSPAAGSPRQPFIMPNMDPLVRQQGLAFQQSELLREQFMKFAEALQKLHAGLEEMREDIQADRQQRLHEKDSVAAALASIRNEVHEHLEERLSILHEEVTMRSRSTDGELQRLSSCLDSIAQQIGAQLMAVTEDQRALSENVHTRMTEFQNSFSDSAASRAMLDDLGAQVEAKIQGALQTGATALHEREEVLVEKIANVQTEAACEAEQWKQRFHTVETASQQLCTEMAAEHQQTRISAIGLATELSELRDALAKESQSYQESTTSVQRWVTETMALRQSLEEEELAHAALNGKVAEHAVELQRQVAMSKGLANAHAEFKTGKEELWQVVTSAQENNEQTMKDIQELRLRTQHMEVQRFGQVSRQLEELTVQHSAASSKIEEIEQSHNHGQKAFASKLDSHAQSLLQAQQEIKHLVEQSAQHDFIESRDQQYRLYVTMDGDIGIFRRSGWGKHGGGDFAAVPRWHAGATGDKALCSVNRETQAYEKDRFLAMANRFDRRVDVGSGTGQNGWSPQPKRFSKAGQEMPTDFIGAESDEVYLDEVIDMAVVCAECELGTDRRS
ncbi:hypothetical protein AK812_SmicGene25317 [Symbiodinium microadriaticum]|uniref:Uncharacterized protein n=1 Tax=Symbiodinium microadriaticum TaxID=2951 RepID=A0A1Q9DCD4_SYMMI|nr:hypothetical protein AK812_SmicGene25317 [Symbiodinium microadriaticum]